MGRLLIAIIPGAVGTGWRGIFYRCVRDAANLFRDGWAQIQIHITVSIFDQRADATPPATGSISSESLTCREPFAIADTPGALISTVRPVRDEPPSHRITSASLEWYPMQRGPHGERLYSRDEVKVGRFEYGEAHWVGSTGCFYARPRICRAAYKPKLFQSAFTRFLVASSIRISSGQGRRNPSEGHFRVASMPILEP